MPRLVPVLERVAAAPEALRAPLSLLASRWARGESPREVDRAVRDWMEGDAVSYLAGGAFFEATGGFLRRFALPGGRPDGEWSVPPAIALAADGGVTFEGNVKLAPLFPLGGQRVLWLARGYRADDSRYLAIPVIFDPKGSPPWLAMRPMKSPDDLVRGTAPRSLHDLGAAMWLLTGEVDGGAEMHIDEFIPVAVHWELNLATGTYRFVSEPDLDARIAPARLAVAPADDFADVRKISFDREGDTLVLRPPYKEDPPYPLDLAFHAENLGAAPAGSPLSIASFALHGALSPEGAVAHDFVTRQGARRTLVWTPESP